MARAIDRIECPPEFQQHLTDIFGVNRFGDPLFRFIWGQTETEIMLNPKGFYEETYIGHGQPCWILQQWEPPESYGFPEVFYCMNTDLENGLPVMLYPEFGRYKDFMTFLFKEYDSNTRQLSISTVTLDWVLIDRAIPLMIRSLELSELLKQSIIEEAEQKEEEARVMEIADRLHAELPTFYGPTSFRKQNVRTSVLERKMAEIEKEWRKFDLRREPIRGIYQDRLEPLPPRDKN